MSDLKATLTYNGKSESITGTKFKFNYATYPSTSWYEEAATRTESCNGLYMKGNYSIENENGTSITLSCADHIMKTNISTTIEVVTPTTYIITIPSLTIATLVVKGNYGGSKRTLSNGDTIYEGEKVTWTATCPNGYHFDSDNSKLSDDGSETVSGNYTVPRSDATWSTYSISWDEQHVYVLDTKPTSIQYGDTTTYFKLDSPAGGYELKNDPYADHARITLVSEESGDNYYIYPDGQGDITVHCIATVITYTVNYSLTNCDKDSDAPTSMTVEDNDKYVTFTPFTGYTLSTPEATNATITLYSSETNTYKIKASGTGNITITCTATASVTVTGYGYPNWVEAYNMPREYYNVKIEKVSSNNDNTTYHQGDTIKFTAYSDDDETHLNPVTYSGYMAFGKWELTTSASTNKEDVNAITDNPYTYTIPSGITSIIATAAYQLKMSARLSGLGGTVHMNSTTGSSDCWIYGNYYDFSMYAVPEDSTWEFDGWYSDESATTLLSTDNPYRIEYVEQGKAAIDSPTTFYGKFRELVTVYLTTDSNYSWQNTNDEFITSITIGKDTISKTVYLIGNYDDVSSILISPTGSATVSLSENPGGTKTEVTISNVTLECTITPMYT